MTLLLSRKEKEELVIKLAREGKTTREIAKIVHISLKDIGEIIRKFTGESNSESNEAEKEKERLSFMILSLWRTFLISKLFGLLLET